MCNCYVQQHLRICPLILRREILTRTSMQLEVIKIMARIDRARHLGATNLLSRPEGWAKHSYIQDRNHFYVIDWRRSDRGFSIQPSCSHQLREIPASSELNHPVINPILVLTVSVAGSKSWTHSTKKGTQLPSYIPPHMISSGHINFQRMTE